MDDFFLRHCKEAGITVIPTPKSDFNHCFCDVETRVDTPTTQRLYYYVQSMPGYVGTIAKDNPLVMDFQMACDEWTKHIDITFERVMSRHNIHHFKIRCATKVEEEESSTTSVMNYFIANDDIGVLCLWRRIKEWQSYAVFLHAIGHIIGLAHEDAFGPDDTSMICESIMSYAYISQFQRNSPHVPCLSGIDKERAHQLKADEM